MVVAALLANFYLPKLWRVHRTERRLNQVIDEVKRDAFDIDITIDRLKVLEKRGVTVPSVIFGLLRQKRPDIKSSLRDEWVGMPDEDRDAIDRRYAGLIKQYS
jgi:hypothetical protein